MLDRIEYQLDLEGGRSVDTSQSPPAELHLRRLDREEKLPSRVHVSYDQLVRTVLAVMQIYLVQMYTGPGYSGIVRPERQPCSAIKDAGLATASSSECVELEAMQALLEHKDLTAQAVYFEWA